MCVISRYGSIAPTPATPHTTPTAPEFSALTRGTGVRGFYIIMRAWRERVKKETLEIMIHDYFLLRLRINCKNRQAIGAICEGKQNFIRKKKCLTMSPIYNLQHFVWVPPKRIQLYQRIGLFAYQHITIIFLFFHVVLQHLPTPQSELIM